MSANSPEPRPEPDPERVGGPVEVVLRKAGRTKIRYAAELLRDDGNCITVRAPWAGAGDRDFGFVRFEVGDVFTEHYWRDRWYAVKEVHAPDGTLKGWYCDVTRPAELHEALDNGAVGGAGGTGPAELVVEDLDLDLWASGDGRTVLRLDEDEFAESGLTERDPAAAAEAVRALDELELHAKGEGLASLVPQLPPPHTRP
ncbi:DUF402 domain-containing protein [Streptomyces sp. NPDC002851]